MVITTNLGLKTIKVMSAEIKNLKNLQNTEYSLKKLFDEAEDFLPMLGTDYVELYVGNAKQSAHYYKTAFGFQSEAYAGLETGMTDRVSYVLKQDKIRL
jgi:4-hydroxyphenylpyruvate dioxygenase